MSFLTCGVAQGIPRACQSPSAPDFLLHSQKCVCRGWQVTASAAVPPHKSFPAFRFAATHSRDDQTHKHIFWACTLEDFLQLDSKTESMLKAYILSPPVQKKEKKEVEFLFSEHKNAVGGQWANCTALALLKIIYCREKSTVVGHCVYSTFREDHITHKHDRTMLSSCVSLSLPICRTVIVGRFKVHNR